MGTGHRVSNLERHSEHNVEGPANRESSNVDVTRKTVESFYVERKLNFLSFSRSVASFSGLIIQKAVTEKECRRDQKRDRKAFELIGDDFF